MGARTAISKLPIRAISALIDERISRPLLTKRVLDPNELRKLFRDNQLRATVAMLDTDAVGISLICQTENGWTVRIPFTDAECLDLARTLLAKVRAA